MEPKLDVGKVVRVWVKEDDVEDELVEDGGVTLIRLEEVVVGAVVDPPPLP